VPAKTPAAAATPAAAKAPATAPATTPAPAAAEPIADKPKAAPRAGVKESAVDPAAAFVAATASVNGKEVKAAYDGKVGVMKITGLQEVVVGAPITVRWKI
jgi:hypothetical protein